MKIIVGVLHHETNTLSPVKTRKEDFEVIRGEKILDKIAVTSFFRKAGIEMIPALYANALPSGLVEEKVFLDFRDEILSSISRESRIDGIWFYLHGSMEVENIGSGEANLVSEIRKIIGERIPLAVALDLHANMTETLVKEANVICGYRTAPHIDQEETQIRAAKLLLRCINEKLFPQPVMIRPSLLVSGDMVTTTVDPGRSLIKELENIESQEGIFWASLFVGQPWVDAPNTGASVVVAGEKDSRIAMEKAKHLAGLFWDAREKFHFEEETAQPEETVEKALMAKENPVFITDSGDNTTAGASGDSAYLLGILLDKGAKKTLIAGITDPEIVTACEKLKIGDRIEAKLGAKLDPGKSQSLWMEGKLKARGRMLGWFGEDAGPAVVIAVKGIDIIITEKRCGVVSPEIIESAGVKTADYRIIVVKLGYLWDALRKISKRTIMALTPGASCEDIEKIVFHNIKRPIYPIDKDFDWDLQIKEVRK